MKISQFFSLCLALVLLSPLQGQSLRQVLNNMYKGMENTKHYSYDMYSKERLKGKYSERKMYTHINEKPKKIYMKNLDDGVEVLYVHGWNNNKAYINPNGFPWTNVSFDINNSRVRADGHHIMTRAGFTFTNDLMHKIEAQAKAEGKKVEDYVSIKGESTWMGKKCYRLYIDYPQYAIVSHKVTKTQSVIDFALEHNVPEYKILELNGIGYGGSVKQGQTIKKPNVYAKQVVFYVDQATWLPVVQMLYDEIGLYEKYEYRNLKINPPKAHDEWNKQCKSYGF